MHDKRGMSAVVTTLIIILLAIVAIGIIWVVVKNILDKGRDEITLTGLTLDLEITKASVEDDTLSVTVKRNSGGGNLIGINFIIGDGDNSVVVTKDTTLAKLGFQTFTFTLSALAVDEITSISVAPIFETSSGKEATGEILDTTTSDSGDLGTGGGEGATGDPGGEDPPCTADCTGLNCGDDGCTGSCGECSVGYSCAANQTCMDDNCVLDCTGLNCGDDGCGDVCGTCTEPDVCNSTRQCVPPEECTDDCSSPISYTCGIHDICGVDLNCEELVGCESGWECVGEDCVEITYLNSGSVIWFGPPGVTRYFSSDALPDPAITDYDSHFVTFPNLAIPDCYYILNYNYDDDVYEYVIVELLLPEPITIVEGESYEIWESDPKCRSSLGL